MSAGVDYGPSMGPEKAVSVIEQLDNEVQRYADFLDRLENRLQTVLGPGGSDTGNMRPTEAGAHKLDELRIRLDQLNQRLYVVLDRIYL